ncbi:MAG: HYR domain-containing protein [Cyclobacteriaceae bacterium]
MAVFCRFGMKSITNNRVHAYPARIAMLVLGLFVLGFGVSAQTVKWTDSFIGGQQPTAEQCEKWTTFLTELSGKNFASVKLSGTFDEQGKSISDPVAATQLAALLSSKTAGVVNVGSDYWVVTLCGGGACNTPSVTLSYKGNQAECDCSDNYTLRPHAAGPNWGGVNSQSCSGPSQTMSLEFNSGVSISANGPTSFCVGGNVILTAQTEICSPPLTYLWSNGATTESITVNEPGSFSVTVSGAGGCSGISETIQVSIMDISVIAGEDVTICDEPVQLYATGVSGGGSGTMVNKLCLFDASGGAGNCTFTNDLCTEGAELISNQSFSQSITILNPIELNFHLYYSPILTNTNFLFKLNGQQIDSFVEADDNGACDTRPFGQYPRSFSFEPNQFIQHWNQAGENIVSVEILSDAGLYLAGIIAEVVSSNEFYSWSPSAGLSNASIQNPLASPEVSTLYTVTYTNAIGCTDTDQVQVNVICDTAPVAICKSVSASAASNCAAIVAAKQFDGGSTSSSNGTLTFTVSPAGPYAVGTTEVTLTVTDSNGESSSCKTTVTVTDTTLPSIVAPEDVVVANGEGVCSAKITLTAPEASDNCELESLKHDQTDDIFPVGETIVTWTAKDVHGNQQTATQNVIVNNTSPVINSVVVSPSTAAINSQVTLGITYTDNNVSGATIDWDDFSAPQTVNKPANIFEVFHSYAKSGSYSVTITLTDECGSSAFVYETIMVFEKRVGSVRGSGWFNSMPGYYLKDRKASGKAQFAFTAEYKNLGTVPVGNTTFNFKAGNLKFRSAQYELLLVDGENAFLTGTGKLNNKGGYGILISMVDDETKVKDPKGGKDKKDNADKNSKKSDRIRVKIWDPSGKVIYDTQLGAKDEAVATTVLGGGSIEIEKDKMDFMNSYESPVATSFGEDEESTKVFPNPYSDWVEVQFHAVSQENITILIIEMSGNVIFNQIFPVSEDGSYSLDLPSDTRAGFYILKIKQGNKVEIVRLERD